MSGKGKFREAREQRLRATRCTIQKGYPGKGKDWQCNPHLTLARVSGPSMVYPPYTRIWSLCDRGKFVRYTEFSLTVPEAYTNE